MSYNTAAKEEIFSYLKALVYSGEIELDGNGPKGFKIVMAVMDGNEVMKIIPPIDGILSEGQIAYIDSILNAHNIQRD